LEIFGEKGWNGLTMDEVAARARVGKSSLYLRWPDKATLLAAALRAIQLEDVPLTTDGPTGTSGDAGPDHDAAAAAADQPESAPAELSLRDYLVAHARRRGELYLGEHGLAMLRLYAEARAHEEIFAEVREEAISRFVREERRRVEAAVRDGDLPPTAAPVRSLAAVEGAIFMHILVTPPELVARVRRGLDAYIGDMVDDQLRAAGFSPRGS
jgi:AcrR family transcriptional regulator